MTEKKTTSKYAIHLVQHLVSLQKYAFFLKLPSKIRENYQLVFNKPLYHKANSPICMIWLVGGFFVC